MTSLNDNTYFKNLPLRIDFNNYSRYKPFKCLIFIFYSLYYRNQQMTLDIEFKKKIFLLMFFMLILG